MISDITPKIVHTAQIVVTAAACVADPSGLTTAATLTTGALSLPEIFKRNPDATSKLTKTVSKALSTSLKNPTFHMPAKGSVLLPQMLDQAVLMPTDLVDCGLNPDLILGALLDRHVDPEHRTGEMAEAFCNWLRPPLTKLLNDPEFIEKLAPSLWAETLKRQERVETKVDNVPQAVVDLLLKQGLVAPQAQDHAIPLADLIKLAGKFGTTAELEPNALVQFLSLKAEDYNNYRALIDGLDERVAAIANLKGAAQDAAERLDFEEVEVLLSRVDVVETEIAADTKQARAANALQRGKVQQAYDILNAAADSFASVDKLEPSRRRNIYGAMLYEYGLRFAGEASELAVKIREKAASDVDRKAEGDLWASLLTNMGSALQVLGARESGTARLEQAVQAFENALKERTKARVPLSWAVTQNNLGNALSTLGERASGTARLEQAVQAFENALQERTQARVPMQWATTQFNLSGVHLAFFDKTQDAGRLDIAEAHVRAALKVFEQAAPHHAGMAQERLLQIEERRASVA